MSLPNEFIASITAMVASVWPEVATTGVWEEQDISFVEFLRVGAETGLAPQCPFAVIEFTPTAPVAGGSANSGGGLQFTGGWGIDNRVNEGMFMVHYIMERPAPVSGRRQWDDLRDKLWAMRDYLLANDPSVGQILDVAEINWSKTHNANATFIHKRMPNMAGSLSVYYVLGDHA